MEPTPLILPRSKLRYARSPVDGCIYRILIALPEEPPPPDGYPAVFLLDANATFLTTVESLRMRSRRTGSTGIEPAVIVGIGYDTSGAYDEERRIYDFTRSDTNVAQRTSRSAHTTGGSAFFARFIDEIVRPLAANEAPLNLTRQSLIGHSLGGCFVLSRLLEHPQSFESYIAISPSIWSDEAWLLEQIKHLPARFIDASPRRVLITVGEFEQSIAPWQSSLPDIERIIAMRSERAMRDKARNMASNLVHTTKDMGPNRLIVRFEELLGEDHSSSALVGISHGLRMALWAGAAALHNVL